MSRRRELFLFLGICLLFLLCEQGAYRSYFQDDDLDTLGWTRGVPWLHYLKTLVSPQYFPTNFRPTGHVFYRIFDTLAPMNFAAWVAGLQAIHLLNFGLLWLVLRRFGCGVVPTAVGVAFVAFHKAVFDIYWRPMYVFDALCATFCLLTLLLYMQRRWVLAFVTFWIAYRAKELAVMLPIVLLAYEYWFGDRKWWRLVPFFLTSASFGIQAMLFSPKTSGTYTLQFVPKVIWQSANVYAQKLLFAYSGFLMLALAWFIRDRRVYLGLLTFWLLLVPLLPLPLRQNRVYLYLPLIGVALVLAVLTEHWPRAMAAAVAIWMIIGGIEVWRYGQRELPRAAENRDFVETVRPFVRTHSDTLAYIYDGAPPNMRWWGVNGAISYYFREHIWRDETLQIGWTGDKRTAVFRDAMPRAMMHWDATAKHLTITPTP